MQITGLILEKITEARQRVYKRVGVFRHPWGPDYTQKERADFPEFARFGTSKDVREEITII